MSQDVFNLHRSAALTFAGPLATSSYMLATGSVLGKTTVFGILVLSGTLPVSFFMAITTGRFRWFMHWA